MKAEWVGLIAEMEAGIDFAEDDIDVMAAERIAEKIARGARAAGGAGAELRLRPRGALGIPAGHRGAAQRGQVEPLQPAGGARAGDCDCGAGDDARHGDRARLRWRGFRWS